MVVIKWNVINFICKLKLITFIMITGNTDMLNAIGMLNVNVIFTNTPNFGKL